MDAHNIRYIVFLLDSKFKEHDGNIFRSHADAKEYANNCIDEHYCDKIVIGMFVWEPIAELMHISMVETIGFKKDKKYVNQMDLFKPISK